MASAPSTPKAGWEVKTLGEVCGFQGGSQPPKSTFINNPQEGYVRLLQIRDFKTDKYITFIPESPKNRICNEEDILIGRYGASVGQIHTGKVGAYNVALMKTLPDLELLNRRFFYLYLQSHLFQSLLMSASDRAAQNGFSKNDISPFPVPVPPLAEQERIVGILDEAFEGIAAATAQAEQNLHNARELFQSVLQSTFSQKGGDWVEKTLGDCCETTQGVQIPKSQQKTEPCEGFRRYLYISDFEHDRKLKYVKDEHDKKIVSDEDFVVANTGSAGKIYRGIDGVLSNNLFRITVFKDAADKEYLFYFITSPLFIEFQSKIMRGTANPHMGHKNFKSTPINLPSLPTQQAIVEKLDALSEETKALEAIYERKQSALAELKQSLLQKAFAGEL